MHPGARGKHMSLVSWTRQGLAAQRQVDGSSRAGIAERQLESRRALFVTHRAQRKVASRHGRSVAVPACGCAPNSTALGNGLHILRRLSFRTSQAGACHFPAHSHGAQLPTRAPWPDPRPTRRRPASHALAVGGQPKVNHLERCVRVSRQEQEVLGLHIAQHNAYRGTGAHANVSSV